jgi:hypothetical protein
MERSEDFDPVFSPAQADYHDAAAFRAADRNYK